MTEKTRTHKLCEKHPLIATALGLILPAIFISLSSLAKTVSDDAAYIAMIIASIITLILFKAWFSPEFKGFLKAETSAKTVCLLLVPYLVFVALNVLSYLFFQGKIEFNPSVRAVTMGLAAGFNEETMFRICALSIAARFLRKENRALITTIVLAVLFGLSHAANVQSGANPAMTVVQVVTSIFIGLFLAALYLRSGSIVLPIFAHAFYDWVCFVTDPTLSDNGIVVGTYSTGEVIYAVVITVLLGAAGIYLLRKPKLSETNDLWYRKWSYVPSAEPAMTEGNDFTSDMK